MYRIEIVVVKLKWTNLRALVFPFILCLFFSDAIALEIGYSKQTPKGCQLPENAIVLSGRIHLGDNEKISKWLRQNTWYLIESNPPFVLDLQGGSVYEAMKIADMFKQILASVWLPKECENSPNNTRPSCTGSCFAILVGAVNRLFSANSIGLNRPAFSRSDFANLDGNAATKQHQKNFDSYINWLKEMQVPESLIEKVKNHSPENILWLSDEDVILLPETSPEHQHLIETKCKYQKGLLDQWMDAYSSGNSEEAKTLREKWDKQSRCLELIRIDARERWALQ